MENNNPANIEDLQKKELLKANTYSKEDLGQMLESSNLNATALGRDPFRQAKVGTFNAGSEGLQLDRYYNHPAYNRLGFNPYINVEEYYNENSSAWEDFQRTQQEWWTLAGLGFKSAAGLSTGSEDDQYMEASRIGSTTRGGWFETFNNTYLNSGYTIGLLSEIALEEVGMGVLTLLTEGGTGGMMAARTAQNAYRLGKIGSNIGKFTKNLTRTFDRLNDLKNMSTARTFWNGVGKGASALNPLKGTTDFLKAAKAGKMDNLTTLATANKAFGSFYRDIREINLALAESELEAGFASSAVMDELYEEFEEKHGKAPQGKELEEIKKLANSAGESTYLSNAGLIYATNRIAFDGFFRKFSPKFGNRGITQTGAGKVAFNKNFMKSGKPAFEVVKDGFKHQVKRTFSKSGLKQSPINALKFMGKYTRVNFAEGIQELGQEIIQDANVRRAKDDYYGAIRGGYYDYLASSQYKFSGKEGLDIFMSGFLMGGIVGPYVQAQQFALEKGAQLGKKVFQPGKYKEEKDYKAKREKHLQEQVDKLNEMTKNPTKYFNMSSLGALVDQVEANNETEKAAKEGKEKEFRDIEDMATGKAILFALQSGHFDALIEQLEGMSQMSDKELHEAFGNVEDPTQDPADFKKNSEAIINRAKEIKNFYEAVEKRFQNPYQNNPTDDTELGITEQLKWQAFENAKAYIVLNQYSFMRTLERMRDLSNDLRDDAPFWVKDKVAASDITLLLNNQDLSREIELLQTEVTNLKDTATTKEAKSDLKKKEKKLNKLKSFKEKLNEYRNTLASEKIFDQILEQEKKDPAIGARATIKTKKGGEAIIVGETTTKGGKPAWILDDGRRVLKDKVEISKSIKDQFKEETIDPSIKQLQKEFKEYMELIADQSEGYVDVDKLDEAFEKFLDFYALDQDSKNLSELINRLSDPDGFNTYVARENAVTEKLWQDRKEDIKNDLKSYYEKAEAQNFLNELAKKHGAFILEEDLEELLDENTIPEQFYDIKSLKPIQQSSKRHAEIIAEIKEFLDTTGRESDETQEEVELRVATDLSKEAKAKLNKLGFTNEIIAQMSKEDIEKAKLYSSKEDAAELLEKYLPTQPDTPLSIETPISEWPQELVDRVQEMMDSYNKNIMENEGLSETAKKNAQIPTLEKFIQSPARKAQIIKMLEEYNSTIPETPVEETTEEVQEDVVETVEEVTEDQGVEIDEEGQEVPIETGEVVEEETGTDEKIYIKSEISLPLTQEQGDNLAKKKSRMVILPIKKSILEPIVNKLVSQGLLEQGAELNTEHAGIEFTIDVEDSNGVPHRIHLVYTGKSTVNEAGGRYTIIDALALPTEPTDTYNIPMEVDGTTYYVESTSQKAWIEGSGKQQILEVGFVEEIELQTADTRQKDLDKFKRKSQEKLNKAKTPEELELAHHKIVEENIEKELDGGIGLTAEELDAMLKIAETNLISNMVPSDFKVGEQYNMKGKMLNFGPSVVSQVTDKGVIFTSVKTGESSDLIPQKDLSKVVQGKIEDMSDAVTDSVSAKLTEEEKEVVKENQENLESFSSDKDAISKLQNKFDKSTDEDIDNDFINNLGCK